MFEEAKGQDVQDECTEHECGQEQEKVAGASPETSTVESPELDDSEICQESSEGDLVPQSSNTTGDGALAGGATQGGDGGVSGDAARTGEVAQAADESESAQQPEAGSPSPLELLAGEKQPKESLPAIMACNDFLLRGMGRSVRGLADGYQQLPKHEVPTQSYDTLRRWSEKYAWRKRAIEYDGQIRREYMLERQAGLQTGHAVDLARVQTMNRLMTLVEDEIFKTGVPEESKVLTRCPDCEHLIYVGVGELEEPHPNLWTTTVREVGEGENKKTTATRKFNRGLFEEARALMNDLAKETGGRRPKLAENVINRLDLNYLPRNFRNRLILGDNPEDVLVQLIESFYSDDAKVHVQREMWLPAAEVMNMNVAYATQLVQISEYEDEQASKEQLAFERMSIHERCEMFWAKNEAHAKAGFEADYAADLAADIAADIAAEEEAERRAEELAALEAAAATDQEDRAKAGTKARKKKSKAARVDPPFDYMALYREASERKRQSLAE